MLSRAVAGLTLLAFALPMAGAEGAAPRATPVRHRAVSQPLPQPKASVAKAATHKADKGAAAIHTKTVTGHNHAAVPAVKAHAADRRRRRAEQQEVAAPPVMHIARVRHPVHEAENRPAPAPSKVLTSDDFLQAASGPDDTAPVAAVSEDAHPQGLKPLANSAADVRAKARTLQSSNTSQKARALQSASSAQGGRTLQNRSVSAPADAPNQTEAKAGPDPDPAVAGDAPISSRLEALNHPSREELADEAVQPVVLPGLYRNGRLVVPAPLKGSREVLVHQNLMADDEGLERIQDNEDLNRLRAAHQLVNFPESVSLHVNPDLGSDRRCARVWTVKFATDIARQFYARFHEPLQVNSAARTVAYQVKLQRVNGNAAGVGGDVASPHLTGQAIDFGKHGMSVAEIAWMRAYLKPMMDAGKLDVEEEFQQACFHISVYRSYLPAVPVRRRSAEVAQLR